MAIEKEALTSSQGPGAIGPYSAAIRSGKMIFVSGQLGLDPQSGSLVPGGLEEQTRRALKNMAALLQSAGSSLAQVVKTTVFMQDLAGFAEMNAIYAEFFPDTPPARSTVQVAALPRGAAIEIEAIAMTE